MPPVFLYPLKTSENFWGYRKKPVARHVLIATSVGEVSIKNNG